MKTHEDGLKPIYVTQPNLPPLSEFLPYLEGIWATKTLTNQGPFHEQLEKELCQYLGVKNISLFCNGTIALITAIKAMQLTGDVITTPYSFVATSHSILWNGLNPVFVDIDPETFNISPSAIEAAITPKTTAIIPVHCYGYPCDVERIKDIADKNNLKVIYDASHAFGVCDKNENSILNFGDLSVLSFHATKVFNTFEGGAIVSPNAETKRRIDQLKNFGFIDETTVDITGINGKMNEVQAAFGLLNLMHLDQNLKAREKVDYIYRQELSGIPGIKIPEFSKGKHNFAYMPILVGQEYTSSRDSLFFKLKKAGINSRRYFYPLITEFPMYSCLEAADARKLQVAKKMAEEVICLPIYPALTMDDISRIVTHIKIK